MEATIRKVTVGMLQFPGFQLLDIAGPSDAFGEVAVLGAGRTKYNITTIGTTRGPIRSSSGITVVPDRTIFDPGPELDTLIVPGGLGVFDVLEDDTLMAWLKAQAARCRRIGTICNGVFAVAAAGLVNGRRVTTHWMDASRLAAMFPKARVSPDSIYVKDGQLYTTAGVTAGIDLSLVLIEEDFGRKMALDVAKFLIVYLRRPGGQSQFSPLLEAQSTAGPLVDRIREHVTERLAAAHSVESLAEAMGISARHLSRVFSREAGGTLMNFVNDVRIDAVRAYLEGSELELKEIAQRCGFDGVEALPPIFLRRLDIAPAEYRARFRSAGAEDRAPSGTPPEPRTLARFTPPGTPPAPASAGRRRPTR